MTRPAVPPGMWLEFATRSQQLEGYPIRRRGQLADRWAWWRGLASRRPPPSRGQALAHVDLAGSDVRWMQEWSRSCSLVYIGQTRRRHHARRRQVQTTLVTEFGRTDAEKALLKILTASNEVGRFLAGPPRMPAPLLAAWRTAFDQMVAD